MNTPIRIAVIGLTVFWYAFFSPAPASAQKYNNDTRYDRAITIVSGFAKNVGTKGNERVVVNKVPAGKKLILTDIVADRSVRTFSFSISGKISLSININEYKVDQSPAWHFESGIPFKAGEEVVIKKIDGTGNVFISGYLVDDK